MSAYPKRLIEVDLPIKRISAHARREKSIRHGHISTLHIWWARRPLAACRAVLCASLWPAPTDPACPPAFLVAARAEMAAWTQQERLILLDGESQGRFLKMQHNPAALDDPATLQTALFDFIADFANWDNSAQPAFLATARRLTQAAHEALGGAPGTRPLVVDPFAGGGSIPLEALRIGADAFASDLNPVAVLLNKVVLEYIPKYGPRLADEVRVWGRWIQEQAEQELAPFYPKDPDGATPIAYLWARTIRCEGPGCGAEVPLIRSMWLAKKGKRQVALRMIPNRAARRVDFDIVQRQRNGWTSLYDPDFLLPAGDFSDSGTVERGAATCPCCRYITPVTSVRRQLKERRGGADDAQLLCAVTVRPAEVGRCYRLPTAKDREAVSRAKQELAQRRDLHPGKLSLVPDELISLNELRRISVPLYGMERWGDIFTARQALLLATLQSYMKDVHSHRHDFESSIKTCLSLAVGRQANATSSLSRWNSTGEKIEGLFARQAIPMLWDFAEVYPFSDATGSFLGAVEWVARVCEGADSDLAPGQIEIADAARHILSDDMANAFVTDPPYYDSVPYSHLSDFFYVWIRRSLGDIFPQLLRSDLTPKGQEIVVDRPHELSNSDHDIAYYERELTRAFAEARRVLAPDGIGTIVFASKTTSSWEAILQALLDAGWIIIASWPVDTELASRIAARNQARLASSIHIVCRPREDAGGDLRRDDIGNWRDVLRELPTRINAWLPRLAADGVVGADAIFACLGPALEIFSRYTRVEKASGETVTLSEYLIAVWAAVSRAALAMVFEGADTAGFEEDARLTAIWLWTLRTDLGDESADATPVEQIPADAEDGEQPRPAAVGSRSLGGFALEYDAARKLAQGLGAHLEGLADLVEVRGSQARLLSVSERRRRLLGDEPAHSSRPRPYDPAPDQLRLFESAAEYDADGWSLAAHLPPTPGSTTLDRVHQAMLLFGSGRSEQLRRFLVDEGVGQDERFWRLANALSALYPRGDERRWVDGLLARKKGLGF